MPQDEKFDIGKLVSGAWNWRNHLKLGVFIIIALVWLCIYGQVKAFITRSHAPQVINTSGGAVDTSTHKNWWSLIDLTFGGQNK